MKLADELMAQLERYAQTCALPRVCALHLPPVDKAGKNDGEFCALELDDGALGLSYLLLDETLKELLDKDHGGLIGRDPLEIARWFSNPQASPGKRTLGFAAVNALSRSLFDRAGFVSEMSSDSLGYLAPAAGDHVGMIGFFPPLIRRVLAAGANLTVIELNAELAGDYTDYTVSLNAEDLRHCNKVLSTSTVLLNDTLDRMLSYCRDADAFAMIGPSAGCLPDALFARGVTFVGGTWIHDSAGFINAIHTGESWSQFAQKCALRPDSYPGFDALLAK